MGKTSRNLLITALILPLSACQSFALDKEKAAEQRKEDLCSEIETRDLPHCYGSLEND